MKKLLLLLLLASSAVPAGANADRAPTPRLEYYPGVTYRAGAVVYFDRSCYVSRVPDNLNNEPDKDPSRWAWAVLARRIAQTTSSCFEL